MISSIIATAVSGMAAQQQRLDAVAQNIANAETQGYARRTVEMVTAPNGGVRAVARAAPIPGNDGGVDLATEMVDMTGAKLAFEANVAVMEAGLDMWDMLMSALEPRDRDERWR